jgi:hypothetical protein
VHILTFFDGLAAIKGRLAFTDKSSLELEDVRDDLVERADSVIGEVNPLLIFNCKNDYKYKYLQK